MRRLALASFALAAAGAHAHAAPQTWRIEADLGGDKPTVLELDERGQLHVHGASGDATVAISPSVTRATLRAMRVTGVPTIVLDAATPDGDQGIVLERDGAVWKVVQRVALGSADLDREYGYELDVEPEGIYRYQTRAGYQRCDGKPAYLFAEGYTHDLGKFRRLSRVPTNVAEDASVIGARVEDATASAIAARPIVYKARVASHQAGAHDAGELGIPSELDDGDPRTVWEEAFQASDGEGQFFTFEPRIAGATASQLRIVPGNPAIPAKLVRRPKRIAVVWASGAVHVELPDAKTAVVADLPATVTGCVTVVLESSYVSGGPTADGPTTIAELEVFADGERTGGGDAMLAAAIATGDNVQSAAQELARRGAAGVAALDTELGKQHEPAARARLVRALLASRDPAAGPVLARVIDVHHLAGSDLLDAIAALGALGADSALRDLAADSKLELAARVAAVHALTAKPEAAVELAGRGPRQLRHEVIAVLTGLAAQSLLDSARVQTSSAAAGDLYRAATRRARVKAAERAGVLAAMTAALPTANDYERRYRLIQAIAALGDRAALDALVAPLAALPAGEQAALAHVAASALGENPRVDALPLALSLAHHADAGARLAALDALAAFGVAAETATTAVGDVDRTVETALASDSWPEVRRRAAQVLGDRCARAEPAAALSTSLVRDPELEVRGDALAALVQCRASGVAALLARTWDDSKAALPLRLRAVDLTVALGDGALAQQLVDRLAHWRGAALDSPDALALAQNAAYAVGRLAPPGALAALEAGLGDEAFPEIVAASATGLGLLGPACTSDARAKLQKLSHSDERQISAAAARAAAVCGK